MVLVHNKTITIKTGMKKDKADISGTISWNDASWADYAYLNKLCRKLPRWQQNVFMKGIFKK